VFFKEPSFPTCRSAPRSRRGIAGGRTLTGKDGLCDCTTDVPVVASSVSLSRHEDLNTRRFRNPPFAERRPSRTYTLKLAGTIFSNAISKASNGEARARLSLPPVRLISGLLPRPSLSVRDDSHAARAASLALIPVFV
jgi:hypothetical protein